MLRCSLQCQINMNMDHELLLSLRITFSHFVLVPKIATRYSNENGSNLALWVTLSVGLVLVFVIVVVGVCVYRR